MRPSVFMSPSRSQLTSYTTRCEYREPANTMECQCCFEKITMPERHACDQDHHHVFCFTCVRDYVKTELDKGNTSFKCMASAACPGLVANRDQQAVLGDDLFELFSKREQIFSVTKANIDGLYNCPICNTGAIHVPHEDGDIFWCISDTCAMPTCILCKKQAHWDMPCEKDEKREKEKQLEEEQTMRMVKPCKRCNVDIQKTDGCNKMTCICGAYMCWLCGADISGLGYNHFTTNGSKCRQRLLDGVEDGGQLHPPEVRHVDLQQERGQLHHHEGQEAQAPRRLHYPIAYGHHPLYHPQLDEGQRHLHNAAQYQLRPLRADHDALHEHTDDLDVQMDHLFEWGGDLLHRQPLPDPVQAPARNPPDPPHVEVLDDPYNLGYLKYLDLNAVPPQHQTVYLADVPDAQDGHGNHHHHPHCRVKHNTRKKDKRDKKYKKKERQKSTKRMGLEMKGGKLFTTWV